MSRIYRLTIKGKEYNGTLIEPTFHYKVDVPAGGSEPSPNDVAYNFWAHVHAELELISPNSLTITEVSALQCVIPPDIPVAGTWSSPAFTGALAPDGQLPMAVCPVLNFHSDHAGRSARGWNHPPGPRLSTKVNNQNWTTTHLTALTLSLIHISEPTRP